MHHAVRVFVKRGCQEPTAEASVPVGPPVLEGGLSFGCPISCQGSTALGANAVASCPSSLSALRLATLPEELTFKGAVPTAP